MRIRRGISRQSKLFCGVCGTLEKVADVGTDILILECGHGRPHLLDARPDTASLEDMETEIGRETFPPSISDDLTSNRERNKWQV